MLQRNARGKKNRHRDSDRRGFNSSNFRDMEDFDDEQDPVHRDLRYRSHGDFGEEDHVHPRDRSPWNSRNRNGREVKDRNEHNAAISVISNWPKDPPKYDGYDVVKIDDILGIPGRNTRPEKIVIVMRGLPGSGKSFLAKLIYDQETQYNDSSAKILSIDDYFIIEVEKEVEDEHTGEKVRVMEKVYKYEAAQEQIYIGTLTRSFHRNMSDGYYDFIILDCNNDIIKSMSNSLNRAKQFDFEVYICELEGDVDYCFKRNIHNRKLEEIQVIHSRWQPTPKTFTILDCSSLLQATQVEPEVIDEDEFILSEDMSDPQRFQANGSHPACPYAAGSSRDEF